MLEVFRWNITFPLPCLSSAMLYFVFLEMLSLSGWTRWCSLYENNLQGNASLSTDILVSTHCLLRESQETKGTRGQIHSNNIVSF